VNQDIPEWVKYVIGLVLGGGGVAWLRVWLEARRLGDKDLRQTLMDRINALEYSLGELHEEIGSLRAENATLKERLSHKVDL
jgi:hypothetical protein